MNCVMTRGLYLRADGRLPCYCGPGETVTLGRLDHSNLPGNIATDVFESPAFLRIRSAMAQDKVPFPGICEQCTYLDLNDELPNDSARVLEWFHFEPAYACNLDCRWCQGQERHAPGGAKLLPFATMRRIAADFASRGYRLGKGNICGMGEPTLHPEVWEMISVLKESLGGDILLSTNGNGPFSPEIVECGLDKLKIAADAVNQETYARYRKHGKLSRVLDYTAKVAARRAQAGSALPLIIWQYIMFNYNDSDADLLLYQKMAKEHGVDRLRIVYTRCDNYSRCTPENFPRDFPDIQIFAIKEDSLLSLTDAQQRFDQAETLAGEPGKAPEAARLAMGLANHIFRRLLLGVERYVDLLAFTGCARQLPHGNCADLGEVTFTAFKTLLGRIFRLLADVRSEEGDTAQAKAYAGFLRKTGL